MQPAPQREPDPAAAPAHSPAPASRPRLRVARAKSRAPQPRFEPLRWLADLLKALGAWFTPARRFALTKITLFSAFAGVMVAGKLTFTQSALTIALSEAGVGVLIVAGVVLIALMWFDYRVYQTEKEDIRHRREMNLRIFESAHATPEERARALEEATR